MTSHLPCELITKLVISSFFYLHMDIISYPYIGYKRIENHNRKQNLGQFQSKRHNIVTSACEFINKRPLFHVVPCHPVYLYIREK